MDNTNLFKISDINNALVSSTIVDVYNSLNERGYNATSQIIGYLITGDPGYITSFHGARNKITSIDREKILETVLEYYVKNNS
jgi:uncharacterized protein (UPF0297 family)